MSDIHNAALLSSYSENIPSFSTAGLKRLPYCMDSGGICTHACHEDLRGEREEYGYFTADNMPRAECRLHRLIGIDESGMLTDEWGNEDFEYFSLLDYERDTPEDVEIGDKKFMYKNYFDKEEQY